MLLFLDFSGGEFLLIAMVFLMFFGAKSIPNIARSLGKAMREFKEAANSVQRDIQESSGLNQIKEELNLSPDKPAQQSIQQPAVKLPEVVPPKEVIPPQPQSAPQPQQPIVEPKEEDKKNDGAQTELPF
ncbi:MAG: twin-arginine translocase TatA/TatE family subunit [Bacteroidia bacterium]